MGGGGILFLATSFKLYNRCPFWKNIIKIQGNTSVHNAYILFSDGDNLLSIGENVAMGNNIGFVIQESTSLIVGNHCQIAKDVFIRTSDSHSIVDEDGRRVNFAESIKIGNNVWIGQNSIILKGCDIPNNVVIGCASVCTKKEYDGNAVYAGVPARKIKSGVTWRAERL